MSRMVPLFVLALALAGCETDSQPESFRSELPAELYGVQLVESLSGAEAQDEIHRMLGRGVASSESWIGLYREGDLSALLFVSRFESKKESWKQTESMAELMGSGKKGFTRYTTFEIDGTVVHSVSSKRKQHYFYQRGVDLIWVTAPPALARPAIAELLEVSPSNIPGNVQL